MTVEQALEFSRAAAVIDDTGKYVPAIEALKVLEVEVLRLRNILRQTQITGDQK